MSAVAIDNMPDERLHSLSSSSSSSSPSSSSPPPMMNGNGNGNGHARHSSSLPESSSVTTPNTFLQYLTPASASPVTVSSAPLVDPSDEARAVSAVFKSKLTEGDVWSVINGKWWEMYCKYVGIRGDSGAIVEPSATMRPDHIDNSAIADESAAGALKRSLEENRDYALINREVADLLYGWYGGGPRFDRQVVSYGRGATKIDLYPFFFQLFWSQSDGNPQTDGSEIRIYASRLTIAEIVKDMNEKESEKRKQKVDTGMNAHDTNGTNSVHTESETNGVSDASVSVCSTTKDESKPENDSVSSCSSSSVSAMKIDNNDDIIRLWVEEKDEEKKQTESTTATKREYMDIEMGPVYNRSSTSSSSSYLSSALSVSSTASPDDSSSSNVSSSSASSSSSGSIGSISTWRLLRGDDLKASLAEFKLPHLTKVLVDLKKSDGTWSRLYKECNFRDFRVGDVIDACDRTNHWYEGTVMQIRPNPNTGLREVLIHFTGWTSQYDEWIDAACEKLAAHNAKVTTPTVVHNYMGGTNFSRASDYSSYSSAYGGGGYGYGYYSYYSSTKGKPSAHGAVGLRNLGNTCYMNSTLTCLLHMPVLNDYFYGNDYLQHINADNPIGCKGKIAEEFGSLLKEYWSNDYTCVAPTKFKSVISEFQPRFAGAFQHDSQELLQFVLDGLHEDLNQIKKKPYTQAVDGKGRPDSEVATESWEVYEKRNKSVIIDNIHGQIKSRVVCPFCNHVSITFDPITYLSLPLPSVEDTIQQVTFFTADPNIPPSVYGVVVSRQGLISSLKLALSKLCGISVRRMVSAEIFSHKIYKFYNDDDSLSEIRSSDKIGVWEVPSMEMYKPNECIPIQILNYRVERNRSYDSRYSTNYIKPYALEIIGDPQVVVLPTKQPISSNAVRALVLAQVQRCIKKPVIADLAASSSSSSSASSSPVDGTNGNSIDEEMTNSVGSHTIEGADLNHTNGHVVDHPLNQSVSSSSSHSSSSFYNSDPAFQDPALAGNVPGKDYEAPEDYLNPATLHGLPFRMLMLEEDARYCYDCDTLKYCSGCLFPASDAPFEIRVASRMFTDTRQAKLVLGLLWPDNGAGYDVQNNCNSVVHPSAADTADRLKKMDSCHLKDCLRLYTTEETLSENDSYRCGYCKKEGMATKKLDLWRMPNILIIHLKRFAFTRSYRDKINAAVEYPSEGLDLSEFCVNEEYQGVKSTYDLYGVSNHSGSLSGGHYIAHVRNLLNGQWYCHDDSSVYPSNQVVERSAYLLFYVRRDVAAPWRGQQPITRPPPIRNNNDTSLPATSVNENGTKNSQKDEEHGLSTVSLSPSDSSSSSSSSYYAGSPAYSSAVTNGDIDGSSAVVISGSPRDIGENDANVRKQIHRMEQFENRSAAYYAASNENDRHDTIGVPHSYTHLDDVDD